MFLTKSSHALGSVLAASLEHRCIVCATHLNIQIPGLAFFSLLVTLLREPMMLEAPSAAKPMRFEKGMEWELKQLMMALNAASPDADPWLSYISTKSSNAVVILRSTVS